MARQDIIVRLRLSGEEFDREFKAKFADLETAAERQSVAAGARSGGGFMKGFLGAAGVAALGTAIGSAIGSAADLGTEILNTSRQFNIGAEELQVWQQAAVKSGLTADQFRDSLGNLSQKVTEASSGNRAAQQSFVDLGVGFETMAGQARATDAVMLDIAARLVEIEDPAKRAQLGMQLLGDDFNTLYPLLMNGADGINKMAAETSQFGVVLSAKELQDLDQLNKNLAEMKDQLGRRVDQVIAQNSDAIDGMIGKLYGLADAAVKATGDYMNWYRSLEKAAEFQNRQLGNTAGWQDPVTPQGQAAIRRLMDPGVSAPTVTGVNPNWRRSSPRPARNPTQSAAVREAERAAKKALDDERALRDAIGRTLRAQEDSAAVERIRAEQGEVAAAMAEAEFNLLRQLPQLQAGTVEELGKALGHTEAIVEERRKELQLLIDLGKVNLENARNAAGAGAQAEIDRAAKAEEARNADRVDRERDRWEAEYERAIFNVANIYETAFRDGTDGIWDAFKNEGIRAIAEIGAQWTLAMIAGQPFNLNAAAGNAFARSPLASIFMGSGGGSGAANDNGGGFGGIFGGSAGRSPYSTPGIGDGLPPRGGEIVVSGKTPSGGGAANFLSSPGFALGIGSAAGAILGGGQAGQIGGSLGGLGGFALGGPVGAIVGSLLGSILPGLLSGTKRGSVTVGGLGGSLGIVGSQGNSSSREATAAAGAGSLIDAIFQIADSLGGDVDASRGRVSFGVRKDSFRVDPTGRGITKIGNGAVDFGSDQEAAIRFAIQDLIKDGVITGISQASQNLLQRGGNLDAQIEKALLIESVPNLLRQRLDPLGAAVDDLFDRFKLLADAMREGSASAEQFAQARQLWELEKADAIASIGAASQTLQDFLKSLNAGSSSPLSLREQREEAERQFAPFLSQISAAESARAEVDRLRASGASAAEIAAAEQAARTAAGAIDQSGFTEASQLLLSISRQGNASSSAFFSDFDRIRALTGQAAGFVDQASARDADTRDPFGSAIAKNTQDAAYILTDLTAESRAQGETLRQIAAALGSSGGGGFTREPRLFTDAR